MQNNPFLSRKKSASQADEVDDYIQGRSRFQGVVDFLAKRYGWIIVSLGIIMIPVGIDTDTINYLRNFILLYH
jgi:hypothetical protein